MSQLNVLVGAGFSRDAGLPLVSDFNKDFGRDITNEIRVHSAGEWFWKDRANATAVHNGSLNNDYMVYGFVFQEVLNVYGAFTNYEDFFDFLTSKDEDFYRPLFDAGRQKCLALLTQGNHNAIDNLFRMYQFQKLVEIFNCLIIDRLSSTMNDSALLKIYEKFFERIKRYETVCIFTLNHDLLIEKLFDLNRVAFTDGFSEKNSTLLGEKLKPQKIFQDNYGGSFQLFKLHGSAGVYGYKVATEEGSVSYPTGEIIYFKPDSHSSKHSTIRIDSSTKNVVQKHNIDVTPKFITGRDKRNLIEKDKMYSCLFDHFSAEQRGTKDLLVIGYSYGDDHVNKVLSVNNYKKVTNINPSKEYPFSNSPAITNLKSIGGL